LLRNSYKKQYITVRANKILASALIFSFVVSLVYKGPLASAAAAPLAQPSVKNTLSVRATQPLGITIVSLPPPAAVKVVSVAVSLTCQSVVVKSSNLVQDEGSINLNQPANCFSLQVAYGSKLSQNLTVQNLSPQPKIIVAFSHNISEKPDFIPSPFSPASMPALPALSLAILASALILRKKISTSLLLLKNRQLLFVNIGSLQILRC
jgi:hypothetical protein